MKIKMLDDSPYIDGIHIKGLDFKTSQSFAIIKRDKATQVKIKRLWPLVEAAIREFAGETNFIIRRLNRDYEYNGYKYSNYQIKFERDAFTDKWFFMDINWFQYMKIQFNTNHTILNASNIHQLIYAVIGGLVGAFLLRLIFGSY